MSKLIALGLVMALWTMSNVEAKLPDGKIATKLEEYHSTIKCMANIAEHTLPELNTFMTCCGFWALHDFLLHQVETSCTAHNLDQVKHLNGLVVPHIRDNCLGYEHGSFTCRMLVIMPITLAILFVLLILSICVCSCVSFYKWIRVRRKYRRVMNLRVAQDIDEFKTPKILAASKTSNQI